MKSCAKNSLSAFFFLVARTSGIICVINLLLSLRHLCVAASWDEKCRLFSLLLRAKFNAHHVLNEQIELGISHLTLFVCSLCLDYH